MDEHSKPGNGAPITNGVEEAGRMTFQLGRLHVTGTWTNASDRVMAEVGRILREKVEQMPREPRPVASDNEKDDGGKSNG